MTQLAVFSSARRAEGDRLPQRIKDDAWPEVDIFVTYCGEDIEIIANTAKAACSQDYPQGLTRVIVLDDSDSSVLAKLVGRLGKEYPNLFYASRKVQVTTHSKAANLNFGLRHVASMKGEPSDYVAVLDVDMIPEPDWLRQVLPHVHNNPRAALACPFQRFYNIPAGDPLDLKSDVLPIECLMYLQDFSDDTWCTGSGFVARRGALDSIGGFPEELLQEDVLTSNYLSAAGWKSIYVPAPVQWGLGPDTFSGCLKQCQRWTVGLLSISHFAITEGASKLSPEARLNGIVWGIVIGSAAFAWTFAFLALPLLALTGQTLVAVGNSENLRTLSRLASLDFAAQSLYYILMASCVDFRMPFDGHFLTVWTQPWKVLIAFRYYIIPKILRYPIPNFTPTGNAADGKAECAARVCQSRIALSRIAFWDCGAYAHLAVLLCCLAAADTWARTALRTFHGEGAFRAAHQLLTGIAWPHVFFIWLTLAKSAWVPVSYALKPVPLPGRDQLLACKKRHGVDYPSKQVKKDFMRKPTQWTFLLKCSFYLAAALLMETL